MGMRDMPDSPNVLHLNPPPPRREDQVDQLRVRVYPDRQLMGQAAAADVATRLHAALRRQATVRVVFAAAPSQNEFLAALAAISGLDWTRVTAFQMDDYLGLPADAPQRFSRYLADHLFDAVLPGTVHRIEDDDVTSGRYTRLLAEAPIDLVCLGIGENGHIAFNEPEIADFADPALMRIVALDETSRMQQVHDGCFAKFADVPTRALTMTIPALVSAQEIVGIVPGPAKRAAVHATLTGPITPRCPASILRRHPNATLYLDAESAGEEG